MMRSLVRHYASVLAAQYLKRISQERKEKVESWTTITGSIHHHCSSWKVMQDVKILIPAYYPNNVTNSQLNNQSESSHYPWSH